MQTRHGGLLIYVVFTDPEEATSSFEDVLSDLKGLLYVCIVCGGDTQGNSSLFYTSLSEKRASFSICFCVCV